MTERPQHPLAKWRVSRGLTQPELARLVDCHAQTIARIEEGKRAPNLGLALAIEMVTRGEIKPVQLMPDKKAG